MKWILPATLVVVVSIVGAVLSGAASGGPPEKCDLAKLNLGPPGEEFTCILEIVKELQASVNALNPSQGNASSPVPSGVASGGSPEKCDLSELDMEPPYRQLNCILEILKELQALVNGLKASQENTFSTLSSGVASGGSLEKCDLSELDLKSPGEKLDCIPEIVKELQASVEALSASQGITFSVGPDEMLTYPINLFSFPNEHTTIIPPQSGSNAYLVFVASGLTGQHTGMGTVALETTDLQTFTYATGYTSPVMSPSMGYTTCKSFYDPEFDLNYAAQGSVVQDPTLPPGNLIMIYEAENHCPGGIWQVPSYVTVGFARSSDNGKTWPPPVDSEFGGPDRYPVVKISTPEPTTAEQPPIPLGDGLPSAFVDGNNLYVTYTCPGCDGFVRVARGTLGGGGQISFSKWYNGAFSEPGIGGQDSGVLPSKGCMGYQNMAQISYNDVLRLYLMTFVCVSVQPDQQGVSQPYQAAWYFSTATSLDSQNWTAPQMIENSQFPVTQACGIDEIGTAFDGWYPSFMSPGSAAGNTSSSGRVFFQNGCYSGAGTFTFMARTFTITGPPPVVNMSIIPVDFNFGNINIGQSANQTVTIMNKTMSTVDLTGNVGTLSPPFTVVSGGGAFNLAPGQSVIVTVQFSPTTGGAASANLSITHNATNQSSPAMVALSGTGVNAGNCTYTISLTNKTFKANGGSVSVTVSATGQNCPAPSINTNAEWISVSGTPTWKANKETVKIVVQKNLSSQSRAGVVSIGDEDLTIGEDGAKCQLTALSPSSGKYPNTGGSGSFDIAVSPQDCGWNVATTFDWIHLDTTTGTGNGTVSFHLDPNDTGKNITGKINVSLAQDATKKKTFSVNESK